MTIRKVSTILGTVGIALGITLTLLTVFASAQTAAIPQNTALNFEGKSMLKADISAVQGISLTFPGGPWPWYAHQAISIHPEPPIPGHPAEICAEVENHHPTEARVAHLRFGVSGLGIGVGYPPVGTEDVIVPPNGIARGCTVWVPPHPGKWGLEVLLFQDGVDDPERKLHNLDVDEPLRPFQSHSFVFPVINPFDRPVVITLGLVPHLPDWALELSQDVLLDMGPHEERLVVLTVTMPITVPPDGHPIVDVEGWVDGENIGGFRKIFRYPVPLHRFPDPSYAEGEISVYPYPVREGEPTEICVELYNPTPFEQTVLLEFSWAEFGIGLPFHPINGTREVTIPPYSMIRECVHWIPPVNGQVCLQVELFMEGFPPQWSRRNLDVDEPLKAETPHSRTFMVGNPLEEPVTITLGLIPHLPDWGLELSPDTLFNVQPGETKTFTLTVTPPADLPPDGEPIVDVEAYIGEYLLGGFRKIFRPPIRLHPFPDPPYAEREITIQPYPLLAGEPTEICVELRNPTDQPQDVVLHFSWAIFGIGLPFHPIDGPRVVHLPPYSVVRECIHWIPPVDGQVCFQVELDMDGYPPQRSRLNLDVDEPLEPGVPHTRLIEVGNPFDHPVTITLGTIIHLPEWGASLSEDILLNMGVGEVRPVFLTVTPTLDLPPDEEPVVDVEAFVDGELIGGFRKIFRPPVPIHRPMDPIYAESEIYIHPYPPRNREPTLVGAEIRNPTDDPQTVTVTFRAADFGIGLPFVIIHPPLVIEVPPHGLAHPEIMWVPPHGGLWCIQVDLQMEGVDDIFFSQRNIDVGEPLEPGIPHSRPFEVGNPYNEPVTLTLGIIPHLPGWDIELSQDVLPNMEPGEVREVILTVTPGDELPEDEHPVVDVEAYVDGALVGGFRKIYRPPVPIHRPKDPIYAESEIGVDPYPVLPGQPVELSVEVFNPTEIDRIVTATFSVAPFGIGLPFSTAHITPGPILIFIPAHGAARGHVMWQPPNWHGKFCVRVELDIGGHESFWSQRNIDVGEPLEPGVSHSLVFEVGTWPYTEPVTITLGLVKHRPWDISLSERILYNVNPGEPVTVTLTVTPSQNAELGTGDPIVDVEAFVDGQLLGGFRKMDIPPIPLHKPHERGYAESEISINPYPPKQGINSTVSTVVQNNSEVTQTVIVDFGWAKFGMGIPFTNTGMTPVSTMVKLGPYMTQTASTTWQPTLTGHQCVLIELTDPDNIYDLQVSQRNVDVEDRPPCGETKVFTFTVYNDSGFVATVDIGMITFNVPSNWQVTVTPSSTMTLQPFSSGIVTVTVKIPCSSPSVMSSLSQIQLIQEEAGSTPTVDVEGYVSGTLVGGIELQFKGSTTNEWKIYLPLVLK